MRNLLAYLFASALPKFQPSVKVLLLACLLLACLPTYGQNKKAIDSLMRVYNTAKHDTTKVLALASIAFMYSRNKPDTCIVLAKQALAYSEKIKYKAGEGTCLNFIGIAYYNKSNYPLALEYYQKSLKIYEEIGNKKGIANSLTNIGIIYFYQGNDALALEHYQKSLKIYEEIGNKGGIASILNNIGNIYYNQADYPLALEYQQKSLKIKEEIGDKQGMASTLHNIGNIYYNQGNYLLALDYYQKSLKIKEAIGDKRGMAASLSSIGSIYNKQGNYPLALEYHQKSLKTAEEIGDKNGMTYSLNGLAEVAQKQKDYDKSIEYTLKSLQIAQEIKAPKEIKEASEVLYNTYKLKGDYVKALEYHELYKTTNDSLFNVDRAKKIANLEAKAQVERKEKAIALLNKDAEIQRIEIERQKNANLILIKEQETDRLRNEALHEKNQHKQDSLHAKAEKIQLEADNLKINQSKLDAEKKAREVELLKEKEAKEFQTYINYLVIAGLLFVLVFAFFIFRSRQKEKKAKEIITQQKESVQQQKEEIQQINEELQITLTTVNEQKNVIENKNQAIEDSILYAQRIQQVILPLPEYLQQHLPEHFVFFQPKDVVSGDFYYFEEKNDKLILAAIDCTGHGVPGAFMTMIASEILNEIIQTKGILDADLILNELHKRVRIALKQQETQNRDGMDLVLLSIDKQAQKVHFAGAKNPLIYIQNEELHQIKGSKMSIGGEQEEVERIFTKHIIDISKPTTFYLFSDGYQDQIGGKNRKRFMSGKMRELLLAIHDKPMEEQKAILDQNINTWMVEGNEKQIDDILVMGIKVHF